MLKEIIICVVIIASIVFGNNVTQGYTQESVSELSSQLMTLREDLRQENIENEKVHNEMETIHERWRERYIRLAYFIEHDELEKVETSFTAIRSYLETQEYENSIMELDKSMFILNHIEDKYAFSLENIF